MSLAVFVHACMARIAGVDLTRNWYFNRYQASIKFLLGWMSNSRGNSRLLLEFGVHSAGEIPVPIPNTEVKPGRGDYTALAGN